MAISSPTPRAWFTNTRAVTRTTRRTCPRPISPTRPSGRASPRRATSIPTSDRMRRGPSTIRPITTPRSGPLRLERTARPGSTPPCPRKPRATRLRSRRATPSRSQPISAIRTPAKPRPVSCRLSQPTTLRRSLNTTPSSIAGRSTRISGRTHRRPLATSPPRRATRPNGSCSARQARSIPMSVRELSRSISITRATPRTQGTGRWRRPARRPISGPSRVESCRPSTCSTRRPARCR